MFDLFFTVALIAFIYFSYQKPIFGLATIIVLLPSYLWRFNILGVPTTFLELMIGFLFIIWLVKNQQYKKLNPASFLKMRKWCGVNLLFWKKSKNNIPVKLRWFLVLWLLSSIIALMVNPTYSALGLWRAYWLEPMIFFLIFIYTVKDKKDFKIIINALMLLVAWLFTVTIYQNFSSWNFIEAYNYPNLKRLTAVFAYPNALSLLIAPLTALFAGLWIYSKQKLKDWPYLLVAIFGVLLAGLAVSEGALIAIAFSLFILLIFVKNIRKFSIPVFILVVIISFFVLPTIRYTQLFFNQLVNPNLSLQASSLEIRSSQWRETFDMLADRPIFGSGLNGYQRIMENYHQVDWIEIYLYPHNIFLNFWTEMGLLGLAVFVGLMIYVICVLKKLFKDKNIFVWPLTMAWLTWFVHGLVDVPYFKNDLSLLFFIMLGLTIFIKQNKKL
ncbi:O-antigen ligase family protein, partial [bacterium]|nr:O-antigen ligase family protein [bacterium]